MRCHTGVLFLFSLSLCLGAEAGDAPLIVAQSLPGRLPGTLPGQQPPAAAKPAAAASPAPKTEIPAECCDITAIDKAKSMVRARERASGRIVEFKVGNSALLQKLHVGQAVHANFNTKQVSVDGKTMCCTITSVAAAPTVASKTPAQSLPPAQKAPQAQPLPKVASTDPPKTLGAPLALPGKRLPAQPPAGAPAKPMPSLAPLPSRAPAEPPKTSSLAQDPVGRRVPDKTPGSTPPQPRWMDPGTPGSTSRVWKEPPPLKAGPTAGADTYVKIRLPVDSTKSAGIEVTVGNASNINVANVVTKLRVTSGSALVCEAVTDRLYLAGGDAIIAFKVPTRHISRTPVAEQQPVTYQIEVEAGYPNYPTSQVESNTANNQQVATISLPPGIVPRCVKAVSFKDEIYPVFAHYRCINCHGRVTPVYGRVPVDRMRHTQHPYAPSDNPSNCQTCHIVKKWTNVGVPVFWHGLADSVYTAYMICQKVKENTPVRSKLYEHLTQDPRMKWAFNPHDHQLSPKGGAPGGHSALVEKMMSWFDAGKPCPSL